jgi:lysophospholipase L1-like esterase
VNKITFILFFFIIKTFSQDTAFSFINYSRNYIEVFNKNLNYFDSLFLKFDKLILTGNNQIKILHIGDSHIQADILTNHIRKKFAENFYNLIGPPGIGFPYKLIKTNDPISLKIDCTGDWQVFTSNPKNNFSLIGFTAITNDSCSHKLFININKRALNNTTFNKIKIYTNANNNTKIINPLIKDEKKLFFNDTIIVKTLFLSNYTDSIILNLKNDTTNKSFYVYAIILENDDPSIFYHTLAINGAKARTFLNTLIPEFISFEKYDLIIISLGTNDVYYEKIDSIEIKNNFYNLISKIKNKNPNVPIILTTPMEHYYKQKRINPNVEYIRNVIQEIAKKEDCALWDLYEISGGKGAIKKWSNNNLTKHDKLHLNVDGYHLIGDLFVEAFMNLYLNGAQHND